MHYVVTGGAGFIGSNIVRELSEGNTVTVLDDLSSGDLSRISDLAGNKKVEFIQGDITNIDILREAFESADGVFHEAAQISVQDSIKDPLKNDKINSLGTLNVLISARECGVKKVVMASSAAIYGNDPALPKKEDMLPCPLSPYAVSKITGENYCSVFSELYGLKTACLRYFNVFGPGQNPDSPYAAVIPKFIDAVINGRSPVIYGDGEQTRDFIYVKDVAYANVLAMQSSATGIFNVAGGKSVTLNELFEILKEISNSSVEPVFYDEKKGDVRYSVADVSKAMNSFGFRPKYSLRDGLIEIYSSFVK